MADSINLKIAYLTLGMTSFPQPVKYRNLIEGIPQELGTFIPTTRWQRYKNKVDNIMIDSKQKLVSSGRLFLITLFLVCILFLVTFLGFKQNGGSATFGFIIFILFIPYIVQCLLQRKISEEITVIEDELKKAFDELFSGFDFLSSKLKYNRKYRAYYILINFNAKITIAEHHEAALANQVNEAEESNDSIVEVGAYVVEEPGDHTVPMEATNVVPMEPIKPTIMLPNTNNTQISQSQNKKKCSQCGDLCKKKEKFCLNCGTKL